MFMAPVSKPVDAESSLDSESQSPKIKRGAAPPEFTPKDPFDPEIFNRRNIKPSTTDGSTGPEKTSGGK
jgi:hypothetical protein